MSRRRDSQTPDLFRDFAPPPAVARFEEGEVRAATLAARMSRAVSKTLKECGLSRKDVADRMSIFLGDDVPPSMLEAYASQAKEGHSISAVRLVALMAVTGDERLLNALLSEVGMVAVKRRYEDILAREIAKEQAEFYLREANAADARWKAQRP